MDLQTPYGFGYIDSSWLRYDKMANFDDRAKEHVGSVTFEGCIVPVKVIGTDEDNAEISSRRRIIFYYANRMVNLCFMQDRGTGRT
jgi:hypothetical protein